MKAPVALASLSLAAMSSSALRFSPHAFPKAFSGPSSSSDTSNIVDLAYVETLGTIGSNSLDSSSAAPTTLLIHGLDSSSHTWRVVQQSLSTPSVAIDCRGCGRSALGDPKLFSPEAIVHDVKKLVDCHPLLKDRKFVLVGHSMGGRVGMCYTATYPDDVSALVVEDMDARRRSVSSNFIPDFDIQKAIAFDRLHDSLDSVRKAFADIGYPADMLEKWIGEGRIYEAIIDDETTERAEGSKLHWSDVNPAFRALCYETIFDSNCGTESWETIADYLKKSGPNSIDIHLMIAGIGTVCDDASVDDMRQAMGDGLTVKKYPQGTHSIHNSVREEFMSDLERVIKEASK
mmetsp:Transcript_16909/g.33747  ORF Transcript_16909/g.33747 Transcript_16909/m.33747 type:complete len:346 (-) Transcript_16909:1242-2279(-)